MEIISKIDKILQEKAITVDDLIKRTSLPRMTIFNARVGRNVTMVTALKITKALGVAVEEVWSNNKDSNFEQKV